jgi:hypothetical protein
MLLSKSKTKDSVVPIDEPRPITIMSPIYKAIEATIERLLGDRISLA